MRGYRGSDERVLAILKIMGTIDIGWCWLILLIIFLPVLLFLLVVFIEILMGIFGAVLFGSRGRFRRILNDDYSTRKTISAYLRRSTLEDGF